MSTATPVATALSTNDEVSSQIVSGAAESTTTTLSISAREAHELMLQMHACGNLIRKRFMDALRSFSEERLFLDLGFPTIVAYAEATFKFKKSQIYALLRVSKALRSLPKIAAAYETGKLSFSLAHALTRVANEESEEEWLDLQARKRPKEVCAEVEDALRNKRTRPRKEGFGLPGLPKILKFRLGRTSHQPPTAGRKPHRGLRLVLGVRSSTCWNTPAVEPLRAPRHGGAYDSSLRDLVRRPA